MAGEQFQGNRDASEWQVTQMKPLESRCIYLGAREGGFGGKVKPSQGFSGIVFSSNENGSSSLGLGF